jgi:hypothetical protein
MTYVGNITVIARASGTFPGTASVADTPVTVNVASARLDASAGISASINVVGQCSARLDAAAGIIGQINTILGQPATTWFVSGRSDASAGISATPWIRTVGGIRSTLAAQTAISGGMVVGIGGFARVGADAGFSGDARRLVPASGTFAAQTGNALFPGVRALMSGETDAVAGIVGNATRARYLSGETDAVAGFSGALWVAAQPTGRMDAAAGISATTPRLVASAAATLPAAAGIAGTANSRAAMSGSIGGTVGIGGNISVRAPLRGTIAAAAGVSGDVVRAPGGPVPGAPTSLAVVSTTGSTANLSWVAPATGGALNNGRYTVQTQIGAGAFTDAVPIVPYCTPASGSITDAFGNVWAIATSGGGFSNVITINGTYSPPTQQVTMLLLINGTIWQFGAGSWYGFAPTGAIAAGATVGWSAGTATSPLTNVMVTGLTGGTAYNFRVSVSNTNGQSAFSNTASGTTAAVPGPPLTLTSPTHTTSTATLSWLPPNTGGALNSGRYDVQTRTGTGAWADTNLPYCTPGSGTITDAFGNVWSITSGGQISVSGFGVLTETSSVIFLILLPNGQLWQNAGTFGWYWGQTQAPSGGTATLPVFSGCVDNSPYILSPWMEARGFTNQKAANYFNWGPTMAQLGPGGSWNYNDIIGPAWVAHQQIPMWSVGMCGNGENATTAFNGIANGTYDSLWDWCVTSVTNANAAIPMVFLRPGWEMFGIGFPWSVTSGNASAFIAAWKHLYTRFHATCAAHGIQGHVCYSPAWQNDDSLVFPAIVDFVDSIGYDFGTSDYLSPYLPSDTWFLTGGQGNNGIRTGTYVLDQCQQYNKPFAFGEMAFTTTNTSHTQTACDSILQAFNNHPTVPMAFCGFTDTPSETNVTFERDAATSSIVQGWMNSMNARQPGGAGRPLSSWTSMGNTSALSGVVITSLVGGTPYQFQVFATNTAGAGPPSNQINVTTS